ncbi:MAG: hypothetical protein AB1733_19465 [Thermodesulfobacteriota bacterium]
MSSPAGRGISTHGAKKPRNGDPDGFTIEMTERDVLDFLEDGGIALIRKIT